MWVLQGDGPDAVVFRLATGTSRTVGRARGAHLVLDDALVSRVHCRLDATAETVVVTDLESTNGTFVNGDRVATAHAIVGDRIRIGRVEFVLGRSR